MFLYPFAFRTFSSWFLPIAIGIVPHQNVYFTLIKVATGRNNPRLSRFLS
jgi:hypothetical protein